MAAFLRRYAPADLRALREICVRTAAAGLDATDLVSHSDLPGDVFAAPYGVLEPATALVLDDGDGVVVGYAVAALDTASFEARCAAEWWPLMRDRYPLGSAVLPLDGFFLGLVHDPPAAARNVLERHPSHLHINLLPHMQGSGWGRSMIDAILDLLASLGSTGLHLGVSPDNQPAQKFYARLGFESLQGGNSAERILGITLSQSKST